MAATPDQSLPVQHQHWAELKAAYRFFDNPHITPDALQAQHRRVTFESCRQHPVVLCVQDGSNVEASRIAGGQWVMHSALAVTPGGDVLGLLEQRFFKRVKRAARESKKARRDRFRESDVWIDTVQAVKAVNSPHTRLIHICDRGADDLRLMHSCMETSSGFVIRAHHDRNVEQATDKLWSYMAQVPVSGQIEIEIGQQRCIKRKIKGTTQRRPRPARTAQLQVRFATVQLQPPSHSAPFTKPLTVNVVYLKEPVEGAAAVEWMLLTNLPVENRADALTIIDYYRIRWVIEEWHRALKEGCRIGESQLQSIENLLRLISVLSPVAVRLLQLRDWANLPSSDPMRAKLDLQQKVPQELIQAAAALGQYRVDQITPQQFWQTLARQGGWLGRKHDPRPGWKAIWIGWEIVSRIAQGIELARQTKIDSTCG
jgi:Transposase DNA-binding/Transposase DDE domain